MMAKNVENYIKDAISSLQKENTVPWELIVIDDHSKDNTLEVAKGFEKSDSRIRVYKNRGVGKVAGTNYGFFLSKGDIIKCIDSDDVLLPDFFRYYDKLKEYDAHCHGAYITDSGLKKMYVYNVNPAILKNPYPVVLENLISIPKWSWSFKREVGERFFPMPESLPFEDVWISLSVKKNAKGIYLMEKPLYLYRQHSSQTFGGIVNYNSDVVIFRAKRLLKLIEVIENEERIVNGFDKTILNKAREFNTLMAREGLKLFEIVKSDLDFFLKAKVFLIKKTPYLAKKLTVLKWKVDSLLS